MMEINLAWNKDERKIGSITNEMGIILHMSLEINV